MALDRSPSSGSPSRLGTYELLKELSGGGVGSTWLAKPESAEGSGAPPLTIFRLYRHLTRKAEVAEGVLRAAQAAQELRAPNVTVVIDARIIDGEVFVVSEYVEGEPLSALMTAAGITETGRGPAAAASVAGLPLGVVLRIGADVLRALAAAHALSPALVHGELSPPHIRVSVDGLTRVSGFGVSRAVAPLVPMGSKSHERLAYAAPERVKAMASHAAAAPLDPRADLFSLGVLLWEVLAKQRLFASKLEAAIIQKVLTAPIPALAGMEGIEVPAAVSGVIQKALERDPAKRFASAEEMLAALTTAGGDRIASADEVMATLDKLANKTIEARRTVVAAAMSAKAAGDARSSGPTTRRRGATLMGVATPLASNGTAGAAGAPGASTAAQLAITPPTPKKPGEPGAAEAPAADDAPAASGVAQKPDAAAISDEASLDDDWGEPAEPEGGTRTRTGTLVGVETSEAAVAAVTANRDRVGINVPVLKAEPEPRKPAASAPAIEPAPEVPCTTAQAPTAQAAAKPALPKKPVVPAPPRVPGRPTAEPVVSKPAVTPQATQARPSEVPTKIETMPVRPSAPRKPDISGASESSRAHAQASPSSPTKHTPTGPQAPTRVRGRAASAVDRLGSGSTLGRYEILMPVAKGGMAAVWAARLQGTRGFQKIVAIKTMLPDVSDDPDFQTMFLDEARIAARIRHPNVVEILDLGEENDVLYLVMEWVEGETLSTLQKAARPLGGIPQRIALRLASQVCAGLHNAHELRDDTGALLDLVHRDVSPANVLISTAGFVKIVDFGVAKSKGRLHVTRAGGIVKGKTPYLSPEQLGGLPVDRRSDIFSLGALLYVLTTGLHPFRGETEMQTVENIALKNPILPRELNEAIHPEFERLILKALEKDRAMRWSTCAEMQRAIDQVALQLAEPTTDEDVADFVREAIGGLLGKRAKDLRDAITSVDAAAMSEPRPGSGAAAAAAAAAATAAAAAAAASASASASNEGKAVYAVGTPTSSRPQAPVDTDGGPMSVPRLSNSDILDEISFDEAPAERPPPVHPPKLIISPSVRPGPASLSAPAPEPTPAEALAPPSFDPHPTPMMGRPTELIGEPLADKNRRKKVQRVAMGAAATLAGIALIAMFSGGDDDRKVATPETTPPVETAVVQPQPPSQPSTAEAAPPPVPEPLAEPASQPPPTPPTAKASAAPEEPAAEDPPAKALAPATKAPAKAPTTKTPTTKTPTKTQTKKPGKYNPTEI